MHQGNRDWLAHVQARYGRAWASSVLEIGSLVINGSAREILRTERYVGVDRVAGPGADVVVDAERTAFGETFGALLVTSVLEHTPRWREILDHNLTWLRRGGYLLLSWGAEGNQHHAPEPWMPVLVGDVLEWLVAQGDLSIVEAYWERSRFTGDCAGCFDLVAVKLSEGVCKLAGDASIASSSGHFRSADPSEAVDCPGCRHCKP